ncbi:MAG TPA: NACHT domain-containing protein, partial [Polyangium sp.]|nr:NACHT domain-containing protein [Polyangium sp.]
MLVDDPRDTQLGPLVRGLARDFPDLWVLTEAARLNDVPEGAVIVLVTRAEDATWLNLNRPIFADRSFKVVLWNKRSVSEFLVRKAPDFWDWVSRRFEAPQGPAAFAVRGFHMALRARAWAVDFRGRTLDEVFGTAFPKRKLIRVSATAPDDLLRKEIKGAGAAWIAWTNVLDERGALRIRGIVEGAHRRGRNILENAHGTAPDAWPVFDALMNLPEAIGALEGAGLASAGRLGAMLDLEPEAIALAAEALAQGIGVAELEKAILEASDPGAALEKRVIEGTDIDPVRIAAGRVRPPMLRAFGMDTRVREARAKMRGGNGATLAPLAERIPRGGITGGAGEFRNLMDTLLSTSGGWGQLNGVAYHGASVNVYFAMRDDMPELPGRVAFTFLWQPLRLKGESIPFRQVQDKKIAHWIFVTPGKFTDSERELLQNEQYTAQIKIHFWEQAAVENLLRKCPPLLARYYPEEARAYLPGYDGTDFRTLAVQYRAKIANHYNRLKTIGIPPEARPRESRIELPLAELFIPLRFVLEEEDAEPKDLAAVLFGVPSGLRTLNSVILADPGMGKSTLLAYLALVFAGGAPMAGISQFPQMVPMHISLRDFVRRQKLQPGLSFLDYLELDARERFGLSNMHRAFFEATLYMGEAMVLLDGLDEVGNETARHALAAAIRSFAADYPASRFWVTSRIYGYTENVRLPKTFEHYRIARLEKEQIDDFVKRWYRHQLGGEPKEADEQAASLSAAIEKTAGVKRLAGNPLLLTLMAFIHQGLRKLPKDRGELYDKCIEMLLKTWSEARRGDDTSSRGPAGLTLDVFTQKDYLAHLAF